MEGFAVFNFLILVVIFIILLAFKSKSTKRFDKMNNQLNWIIRELKQHSVSSEKVESKVKEPIKPKAKEKIDIDRYRPKTKVDIQPRHKEDEAYEKSVEPTKAQTPEVKPVVQQASAQDVKPEPVKEIKKPVTPVTPPKVKVTPPAPPKKSFYEKYPDMERFIGENLINKIGIAILVLGIIFAVKFAIDKGWINEISRIAIGILCGGILLGIAHKLRKSYNAFSSVLVGGGIAILYATIAIAFHLYNMFEGIEIVAFLIMVVITGFAVLLSIAYDRKELAVISILGGFATPFLVSTGSNNFIALFTYIMILDVGMLSLAYFKKWYVVNVITFFLTIILFGSWLGREMLEDKPHNTIAMIFSTLFYLTFFGMNIINNLKERQKFKFWEISILLTNTFVYFTAGMLILSDIRDGAFSGLFTTIIAIINFVFAFLLYKNNRVDKNLIYLLIGLVLTFISLAAPIQLKGNHITLFWAIEAAMLLWFSQVSGIKLVKIASAGVLVLMAFSLFGDWNNLYGYGSAYSGFQDISETKVLMTAFLNKGYITGFVAVLSLVGSIFLLRREKSDEMFWDMSKTAYKLILSIAATVLFYVVNLLELKYQITNRVDNVSAQHLYLGAFNFLYVLAVMVLTRYRKIKYLFEGITIISLFAILSYFGFYAGKIINVRDAFLFENSGMGYFNFHYINVVLLLGVIALFFSNVRKIFGSRTTLDSLVILFTSVIIVVLASLELDNLLVITNATDVISKGHILTQSHKIGFPILWGLSSFVFMILGMKKKHKELRVLSLIIFSVILLKLFIFDLKDMGEGGRVAAFISLGVLLLVISFMYQKLKKLLIDGEVLEAEEIKEKDSSDE